MKDAGKPHDGKKEYDAFNDAGRAGPSDEGKQLVDDERHYRNVDDVPDRHRHYEIDKDSEYLFYSVHISFILGQKNCAKISVTLSINYIINTCT